MPHLASAAATLVLLRLAINSVFVAFTTLVAAVMFRRYGAIVIAATLAIHAVALGSVNAFEYMLDAFFLMAIIPASVFTVSVHLPTLLTMLLFRHRIKHVVKCNDDVRTECSKGRISKVKFLVIIPAHNEELVIGDLLKSLIDQVYPNAWYRVLVVVDNCTDNTEEVVDEITKKHEFMGYVVRYNPEKRGKQYAVNYGLKKFKEVFPDFTPDYVIVLDADNIVPKKFLLECNKKVTEDGCESTFQTLVLSKNTWLKVYGAHSVMSSFFSVPLISFMLTKVPFLGGTGMVIKYDHLRKVGGYKHKTLVDDLELQLKIISRGMKVRFIDTTFTLDEKPTSVRDDIVRMSRWIMGDMQLIPLIFKAIRRTVSNSDMSIGERIKHVLYIALIFMVFCLQPASVLVLAPMLIYFPVATLGFLLGVFPLWHKVLLYTKSSKICMACFSLYAFNVALIKLLYLSYVTLDPTIKGAKNKAKLAPLTAVVPEYMYVVCALAGFRAMDRLLAGEKVWESTHHELRGGGESGE